MDACAIEMVKICGGVATIITILGGLLATKREIEEWESIKSVLKEGEQKGNDLVTSLLEFSYEDLPCNLKSFFLYFSQYPRREEIKTSEMIQRWSGEGFVVENVAKEHLNELVSRGLIEVVKRSHRGRVKTCRVHEFVRHFCVLKGKEELKLEVDLTFLKLEHNSELPKSFGNLRCLQTLNLERCDKDLIIPDSVWGMGQLRHLYLPYKGCKCETSTQPVGDFPNLLTLVNFPPSNFDLEQNLVKFTGVRKLVTTKRGGEMGRILRSQEIVFNRLQSLCLYGEVVDLEAFTGGSLLCLYTLLVVGSIEFPVAPSYSAIWPSNLTKLVLIYTEIDQSQLGSIAKLQSLQVLFLYNKSFVGKEMVFHKNDLPQLHRLVINRLQLLETWAVHQGALSNLLILEISYCWNLKSVPDGSQYLKKLKDLKVSYMPRSFKERLQEGGEHWNRVSHVPSISFSDCT